MYDQFSSGRCWSSHIYSCTLEPSSISLCSVINEQRGSAIVNFDSGICWEIIETYGYTVCMSWKYVHLKTGQYILSYNAFYSLLKGHIWLPWKVCFIFFCSYSSQLDFNIKKHKLYTQIRTFWERFLSFAFYNALKTLLQSSSI